MPAMTASTTSDQMRPCQPVISPVEFVNQLFAFLKKWPPAPMPMIRAGDLEVAQDERDLERHDRDRGDHQRPRLEPAQEGPDDAGREDVVAAGAGHDRREGREDQGQEDAEDARDDRGTAVLRERPEAPHRDERQRVEGRIERQPDADERGDVEEQSVRDADVTDKARRLPDEEPPSAPGLGHFRHVSHLPSCARAPGPVLIPRSYTTARGRASRGVGHAQFSGASQSIPPVSQPTRQAAEMAAATRSRNSRSASPNAAGASESTSISATTGPRRGWARRSRSGWTGSRPGSAGRRSRRRRSR